MTEMEGTSSQGWEGLVIQDEARTHAIEFTHCCMVFLRFMKGHLCKVPSPTTPTLARRPVQQPSFNVSLQRKLPNLVARLRNPSSATATHRRATFSISHLRVHESREYNIHLSNSAFLPIRPIIRQTLQTVENTYLLNTTHHVASSSVSLALLITFDPQAEAARTNTDTSFSPPAAT